MKKLSRQITKDLDKSTKKQEGIYFTPSNLVSETLQHLLPYFQETMLPRQMRVLEPSCGSGEFIQAIQETDWWNKVEHISAVEKNNHIVEEISKQTWFKDLDFYHGDFLESVFPPCFHLVIGNPPYFVLKKDQVDKSYLPWVEGRPNIFTLFILKSLQLLQPNGILAFVLPKSFLNCAYYQKIRDTLVEQCDILEILETSQDTKFLETAQPTVVIIARKLAIDAKKQTTKQESEWVCRFGVEQKLILTTQKQTLLHLLEGSTTLSQLGYRVSVGNVVWNQVKPLLTDDASQIRLIYSGDIQDGKVVQSKFKNTAKKNYLSQSNKTPYQQPVLLVNRGYGMGKYQFQHAIVGDEITNYLVENHVMVIEKMEPIDKSSPVSKVNYTDIQTSFQNPKTSQFIKLFFGNNAVNAQELAHILPIYL